MSRGHEKGIWYVLESGPYNQALVGLSREEISDWAISLGRALAKQLRGINPFADDLMDERDRYLKERRETGKLGGRPPSKGHPKVTLGSPVGHGGAVPNRTETEPDLETEPRPKEQERSWVKNNGIQIGKVISGGDKYEDITNLSHEALPKYAATFCNEEDPNRAIRYYKKVVIPIIGPEAFRTELQFFVGEISAGEEPRNRGAAFMARLKTAVDIKNQRRKK